MRSARWVAGVAAFLVALSLMALPAGAEAKKPFRLTASATRVVVDHGVVLKGSLGRVGKRVVCVKERDAGRWGMVPDTCTFSRKSGKFRFALTMGGQPGDVVPLRVVAPRARVNGTSRPKAKSKVVVIHVVAKPTAAPVPLTPPAPGSLAAPYPAQKAFPFSGAYAGGPWNVTLGRSTVLAADAAPALDPGWVALSVSVTAEYLGTGTSYADLLDFAFRAHDGGIFATSCGYPYDTQFSGTPALYYGASTTITICRQVPASLVSGGLWRLGYGDQFEPGVYVENVGS